MITERCGTVIHNSRGTISFLMNELLEMCLTKLVSISGLAKLFAENETGGAGSSEGVNADVIIHLVCPDLLRVEVTSINHSEPGRFTHGMYLKSHQS